MKNKKVLKFSTLLLSSLLLMGCASSGGESSPKQSDSEKTTYTVTFMNGDAVFATAQAEANDVVAKPATDPTKEGFEFTGWYTEAEAGVKWVFETDIVTRDMSLFAHYEANQVDYTVNLLIGDEVKDTKTTNSRTRTDVTLTAVAVDEGKSLLGYGTDAGTTAADVDYRIGATLEYEDVVSLADDNHVVNLHGIVKDGEIIQLNVGVWGRYITEANFVTFYDAFKEYAVESSLTYDFLDYTYFDGSGSDAPYYSVANFSAACKNDASIKVAFPTGGNFRGNSSAFKDETELPFHTSLGATVFGETGRYISRWGTDALSIAFTDWVLTEDALKILDPDYVPPKPYPVEEASATKLVIGVWGRWLTSDHAAAVLAAYKTYAAANSITYDEAKIEYYTGTTSTDTYYAKAKYLEAIGGNPAIDVILPVTLSIANGSDSDATSYGVSAKITTTVNLGTGDDGLGLVIENKNDRAMATLNDDTLTASFVAFVNTDAGKKALDPSYGEEEQPEEQDTLIISYYGRYITKNNAKKVTDEVIAYFVANSIEYTSVTTDYVDADTGNNNSNYASHMDPNADICLCGATALASSLTGVVSTGSIGTVQGTNSRVYYAFNNGELTLACITYLTSTAGQTFLSGLTA